MSDEGKGCNGVVDPGDLGSNGIITYQRKKRSRSVGNESVQESPDGTYEHDGFARVNSHWRNTLEYMLHLPGVGEDGGIQSCILDALQFSPCVLTRKSKKAEERCILNCEREDASSDSAADGSNVKLESNENVNTTICQKVLHKIFSSKNFAFLCNLVCENFQNKAVRRLFDFSLINLKMRNGDYEQLPVLFDEDIQLLWNKFQKIGEDILILSSTLSKMSRASNGKQFGEELGIGAGGQKREGNPQSAAELKNSMNSSYITAQFPFCESDHSDKPDQSEASCLGKVYSGKQCVIETGGQHRLICDGCEAICHFSCVERSSQEFTSLSWYCASCQKGKNESVEAVRDNQLGLNDQFTACDRAEAFVVEKNITNKFKECDSDCSNKPDQSEAPCRHKVFRCKHCGAEAIGEQSLICDGCEAMYHFSCAEPSVQEIPPQNWYCASCRKVGCKSPEPVVESEQNGLHQNCVVCDRLEFSEAVKDNPHDSRQSSVSSMEYDEPPEPSRTALAHLCKVCGTCEDDDRRFLTCGHNYCPYKYYHIRCLRNNQIANQHQQNGCCWYCPSCLCRACSLDQDDDKIALCDGCDEAYHTYCMKPPRTSVPKGQWYCVQCNMARAKEGMRRYEQKILQQHGKKDFLQTVEKNRPLDILLNAVDKYSDQFYDWVLQGKNSSLVEDHAVDYNDEE